MRTVLLLLLLACKKYEPQPESPEEMDETMVATFEAMAQLAREEPTCERWLAEQQRRWGARRLQMMVDRMQGFDQAQGDAFRAKYGARIDKAAEVVLPLSQRCLEEARNTPIEKLELTPR